MVTYALSLGIHALGLCEQGVAFIILDCSLPLLEVLIVIGISIACLAYGDSLTEKFMRFGISFIVVILFVLCTAIGFALAWIATLIFPPVPFTVAYQLIALGKVCAVNWQNKKDD